MWTNKEKKKGNKLSGEIVGLLGVAVAIAIFFFGFLRVTTNAVVLAYCEKNDMILTEVTDWAIDTWIQNVSLVAAVFLFVVLFLFLLGQKITYLQTIILGIEALRTHRMNYEIPLEGNNEFTELAESINYLSKTERELQLREKALREEREQLIRDLSHDIRTPLTSILAYSEYMREKNDIERAEMEDYITLMQQKAEQIKFLTNRLLEGGGRNLEKIEHGKFLMEQLADEWEMMLEERFECCVELECCPDFSTELDVQEFRRIFDNLASNVEKYADANEKIYLRIFEKDNRLQIEQKNCRKQEVTSVESHKIGIESIRRIAEQYGGNLEVDITEQYFSILIILMKIL